MPGGAHILDVSFAQRLFVYEMRIRSTSPLTSVVFTSADSRRLATRLSANSWQMRVFLHRPEDANAQLVIFALTSAELMIEYKLDVAETMLKVCLQTFLY